MALSLAEPAAKTRLYFYGSYSQLEKLHELFPTLRDDYEIIHSASDRDEPALYGDGAGAEGWRQIEHAYDPKFELFD